MVIYGLYRVRARLKPHPPVHRCLLFLVGTILLLGPPNAAAQQELGELAGSLRPGDVIRLNIWREPDMSGEFVIDEAGSVVFPRVGEYSVLSETPATLQAKLLADYGQYLRNPSIDVIVLRRVSIIGVGIAFTREYMDETVHTREDIQAATGGVPILGMIPRIRQNGNGKGPAKKSASIGGAGDLGARLIAGRDPRNPVSEAYRSLRTNLTFSNPDKPPKTIVFTSPLPQDGKSTTASNLAITLTQQGIKTLLIDADLRRGLLHGVFGINREPGLTNVLSGSAGIFDAIQSVDLQQSGTLDFMATGPYPPNPAEILGSLRMKSLLEALDERYDLILIDSAPLTVVTDAAVLGTKVDGVVLVARANVTEKGALTYAVEQLKNVRAPILGSVLNDVDYRRDSRYYSTCGKYGYYHHYYYGDDGEKKTKTT